jgi:CRISPR-associated endonuclease/helicase Cas3
MGTDSIANVVELVYPIQGSELPADHGYLLYSAVSRLFPALHEEEGIAIQTVKGVRDGRGNIRLPGKPVLRIRLPIQKVPECYVTFPPINGQ